ncbi:MAG: 2-C-methyl-D-erythritol 4-phosphate cytidylyltransferase [Gemmatimonadota bacterium]
MNVGAIIPAAGSGRRMGGARKAFMEIAGKPMLRHSVEVMLSDSRIKQVVVVLAAEDVGTAPHWLEQARVTVVAGGTQRADSVRAGLQQLSEAIDVVIVHDAARPLLNTALIDRVLEPVNHDTSATLAIQVTDTLHEVADDLQIRDTPDRARFWRAQTPQAFPRAVLAQAFAAQSDFSGATDEAGLVAAGGWPVVIVPGEPWNIKVTTPDDVAMIEAILHKATR